MLATARASSPIEKTPTTATPCVGSSRRSINSRTCPFWCTRSTTPAGRGALEGVSRRSPTLAPARFRAVVNFAQACGSPPGWLAMARTAVAGFPAKCLRYTRSTSKKPGQPVSKLSDSSSQSSRSVNRLCTIPHHAAVSGVAGDGDFGGHRRRLTAPPVLLVCEARRRIPRSHLSGGTVVTAVLVAEVECDCATDAFVDLGRCEP